MIPDLAGWIEEMGELVPDSALMNKGDLVAIFGGWGCGICKYCKGGNEHFVTFQDGQDFLLMMEVILNIFWFHRIDF